MAHLNGRPLLIFGSSPPRIYLNDVNVRYGVHIALLRQQNAADQNRAASGPNCPGVTEEGERIAIRGVLGELAMYFFLRLFFQPINWFAYSPTRIHGRAELEHFIDVKTRGEPWHNLVVDPDDDPAWAYVSVLAEHPYYHITGWEWGVDCQQPQHWRNGAYYLKPKRSIDDLLVEVESRRKIRGC